MGTIRRRAVYLSLGAPHLEFPGVAAALAARGLDAELVHLDDLNEIDWQRVDLVNVRMARGYHLCPDFLPRVEHLRKRLLDLPGGPVPMANPIEIVRAGVDKGQYLRQLQEDGVASIPTRWIPRDTRLVVTDVMEEAGWEEVVIKPLVSSGSWRTLRISRTGVSTHPSHLTLGADDNAHQRLCDEILTSNDVCIQPFLPEILHDGELSFVFLDGRFSHAVRKTVGDGGGWWAHERLGGRNFSHSPHPDELAWATTVHDALRSRYGDLWFGRIDGIRGEDGRLLLLECELAIPRLLLPEGDAFGCYADAIIQRLDRGAGAP
jgi:hypothetical protein